MKNWHSPGVGRPSTTVVEWLLRFTAPPCFFACATGRAALTARRNVPWNRGGRYQASAYVVPETARHPIGKRGHSHKLFYGKGFCPMELSLPIPISCGRLVRTSKRACESCPSQRRASRWLRTPSEGSPSGLLIGPPDLGVHELIFCAVNSSALTRSGTARVDPIPSRNSGNRTVQASWYAGCATTRQ